MTISNHTIWQPFIPSLDTHSKKDLIHYLARQTSINPILMFGLVKNGIQTEDQIWKFLYPSIRDLHDPFLLNDMKKAVIRIIQALKQKEPIMIFGDYDVDGISSSTLLYKGLKFFGANVSFRLPIRHEGYGISPKAIEEISHRGVSLIITVDNGSSAYDAMKVAKEKGIDVIVTDHHEILGEFPNSYAFINPKRFDNKYPYPNLSGAGVAFKLVQALFQATSNFSWEKYCWDYIEWATLGTIADLMPLNGENRAICWLGIQKMNNNPNPILENLFDLLHISHIDSSKIGFQIAPIFNAVGRIDDPNIAVQLLTNPFASQQELKSLIAINRLRQALTSEQYKQAEQEIIRKGWNQDRIIVIDGDFHNGIIGIIAARITENFKKPAIVISESGIGSARTLQGSNFSIIKPINDCSVHLKRYGGHQGAAGLTIDLEKIDAFRRDIQLTTGNGAKIESIIHYADQMDIKQFPDTLFDDLAALEPFGIGNPKPIFYSPSIKWFRLELFGKEKEHAKLTIKKKSLLAFSKGKIFKNNFSSFEFLYTPNCSIERNFLIHDIHTFQ
ncbi:single-stranded-DNA-specific exonuclease [Cytobacillus eiseniae]|uniref:Single-stranded-DNA-specific exonuclease RecJ n=2 Tax=Cytobacillus TaxID=2675230 RepID=A0ABS4RFP5_9BACI|nr:single-stranded-DNA-specific exonuclease [Cytobacillus eiseniae]